MKAVTHPPANLEAVEKKGFEANNESVAELLFALFALAAPSEISNSIRAAIGDDCISQHFTHNDLGIKCNGHLNSLQYEYFNFDCCHSLICSNIWFHFKLSGKKQKAMKCFQESYRGPNLTSAVFRACIYKKLFTFSLF